MKPPAVDVHRLTLHDLTYPGRGHTHDLGQHTLRHAAARFYFGLEPEATPAAIAAIVDYYPVFRIHYES